jgi:hypothetical protein
MLLEHLQLNNAAGTFSSQCCCFPLRRFFFLTLHSDFVILSDEVVSHDRTSVAGIRDRTSVAGIRDRTSQVDTHIGGGYPY